MKMGYTMALSLALGVMGCSTARAVEFLGLVLGAEASSIAECPTEHLGRNVYSYIRFDRETRRVVEGPCFERVTGQKGSNVFGPEDIVYFRPASKPSFVAGVDPVTVRLDGGLIDQVTITTTGAVDQRRIAQVLVEKLGPPTSEELQTLQNAFGATVESVFMVWNQESAWISFSGVTSRQDKGRISVLSPNAKRRFEAGLIERRSRDKL